MTPFKYLLFIITLVFIVVITFYLLYQQFLWTKEKTIDISIAYTLILKTTGFKILFEDLRLQKPRETEGFEGLLYTKIFS